MVAQRSQRLWSAVPWHRFEALQSGGKPPHLHSKAYLRDSLSCGTPTRMKGPDHGLEARAVNPAAIPETIPDVRFVYFRSRKQSAHELFELALLGDLHGFGFFHHAYVCLELLD